MLIKECGTIDTGPDDSEDAYHSHDGLVARLHSQHEIDSGANIHQ
jgi:hypothetical protein